MSHNLVPVPPTPSWVRDFRLEDHIRSWWCPCGWHVTAGTRKEGDELIALLILHHRAPGQDHARFQRGWAVKVSDGAPLGAVNQQVSGWEIMKSPSQDGESLRLGIVWGGGPTVAELISLAESLPWPVGTRLKLSLRRKPEIDHRHPHLHHVQR